MNVPLKPHHNAAGFQWRPLQQQQVAGGGAAAGEVERLRGRYLDTVRDSILGVHLETPERAPPNYWESHPSYAALACRCRATCCTSAFMHRPTPRHAVKPVSVTQYNDLKLLPFNASRRATGIDWPA